MPLVFHRWPADIFEFSNEVFFRASDFDVLFSLFVALRVYPNRTHSRYGHIDDGGVRYGPDIGSFLPRSHVGFRSAPATGLDSKRPEPSHFRGYPDGFVGQRPGRARRTGCRTEL